MKTWLCQINSSLQTTELESFLTLAKRSQNIQIFWIFLVIHMLIFQVLFDFTPFTQVLVLLMYFFILITWMFTTAYLLGITPSYLDKAKKSLAVKHIDNFTQTKQVVEIEPVIRSHINARYTVFKILNIVVGFAILVAVYMAFGNLKQAKITEKAAQKAASINRIQASVYVPKP